MFYASMLGRGRLFKTNLSLKASFAVHKIMPMSMASPTKKQVFPLNPKAKSIRNICGKTLVHSITPHKYQISQEPEPLSSHRTSSNQNWTFKPRSFTLMVALSIFSLNGFKKGEKWFKRRGKELMLYYLSMTLLTSSGEEKKIMNQPLSNALMVGIRLNCSLDSFKTHAFNDFPLNLSPHAQPKSVISLIWTT